MTQEEIAHVTSIIQQDRTHQQQVRMIVEVPFPMTQEEIVLVPTIIQQESITQQQGETIMEVPVPMTQEEIARSEVHVPIALWTFLSAGEVAVHGRHVPRAKELAVEGEGPEWWPCPADRSWRPLYTSSRRSRRDGRCRECS